MPPPFRMSAKAEQRPPEGNRLLDMEFAQFTKPRILPQTATTVCHLFNEILP